MDGGEWSPLSNRTLRSLAQRTVEVSRDPAAWPDVEDVPAAAIGAGYSEGFMSSPASPSGSRSPGSPRSPPAPAGAFGGAPGRGRLAAPFGNPDPIDVSDDEQLEEASTLKFGREDRDSFEPEGLSGPAPTGGRVVPSMNVASSKEPWDHSFAMKLKPDDLKGNYEQCACGHIFELSDEFCFRCGNRRPPNERTFDYHIPKILNPNIKDVRQRLYTYMELYRERKEELRLLKIANEDAAKEQEHPGYPFINPTSAQLAADNLPISQRYEGLVWMKEYMLDIERAKKAKAVEQSATWKPSINRRSASLRRSVEDQYTWKLYVDKNTEGMRQRKLDREMEDCTFKPKIHGRSRRLAQEATHDQVHRRLYNDAGKRARDRQLEQDLYNKATKASFTPRTWIDHEPLQRSASAPHVSAKGSKPRAKTPPPPNSKRSRPPSRSASPSSDRTILLSHLVNTRDLSKSASKDRLPEGETTLRSVKFEGADSSAFADRTPRRRAGPRASASLLPASKVEPSSPTRRRKRGDYWTNRTNASRSASPEGFRHKNKVQFHGGHNVIALPLQQQANVHAILTTAGRRYEHEEADDM